eukprot:scaffold139033_cov47-Prasinocladus_malaysianus.AAC.1
MNFYEDAFGFQTRIFNACCGRFRSPSAGLAVFSLNHGGARGMYMMFCKEKRAKVVENNPTFTVAQIGKQLGEEWRAMTDKDKEKYRALADADKVRYEKEMETYNA